MNHQNDRIVSRLFGPICLTLALAPLGCSAEFEVEGMAGVDEEGLDEAGEDGLLDEGVTSLGDEGGDSGADEGNADGGADDGTEAGEGGADDGDGGDGGMAGSCGAVDMLFVVDNSSSMALEQDKLAVAMNAFIQDSFDVLADASVHVGVITSDSSAFGGDLDLPCDLGDDPGYIQHTGPADAELQARMTCAVQVGVLGDDAERPIDSMLDAIGPGAPAINEGFARPDATLIVVLVSDEDDTDSLGDPADWVVELTSLRGDPERVVVLSLVGQDSEDCTLIPDLPLLEELDDLIEVAQPGDRLMAMTQSFPHHEVGNICEPLYNDFFDSAVNTIAEACLSN